jgi:glycosyltransferase involved in cell wall biosynthesis
VIQVSVILPTRNERAWIGKALDSLLPEIKDRDDVEVLCVDGMSTDGTREVISEYAAKYPQIRLVDNPGQTPPWAMNLGIRSSRGRIILRMDAHSECSPHYIWKNAELLQRTGAECVGGYLVTKPSKDTPVGRAIAAALSSPFGVGGCKSRTSGGKEEESDEATFGCFPRDLFDRIGYFDERLTRNQDMEYFCRIRKHSGRIIISPEILVTYFSRSTYRGMAAQAFGNGLWGAYTLRLIGGGLRLRHLVPLGFVLSLLGLAVAGLFWWPLAALLGLEMLVYVVAGSVMAVRAARAGGTSGLLVLLAFFQLHVSYGAGTLWGFLTAPFKFGLGRKAPGDAAS